MKQSRHQKILLAIQEQRYEELKEVPQLLILAVEHGVQVTADLLQSLVQHCHVDVNECDQVSYYSVGRSLSFSVMPVP